MIQQTIKESLNDHTVIVIAHRISTVLDSDRIVIISGGRIKVNATKSNL